MPSPRLKEKYILARCCKPSSGDSITGYFSRNEVIKVHRSDCSSLATAESRRLVRLSWREIVAHLPEPPDDDYYQLDAADFAVLKHHREYDIDYSLMVAKMLHLARQEAFDRHHKLRNLGLLERVKPVMVRYRKNIAPGKWIKHRNHTYYRMTDKGTRYLNHYLGQSH